MVRNLPLPFKKAFTLFKVSCVLISESDFGLVMFIGYVLFSEKLTAIGCVVALSLILSCITAVYYYHHAKFSLRNFAKKK